MRSTSSNVGRTETLDANKHVGARAAPAPGRNDVNRNADDARDATRADARSDVTTIRLTTKNVTIAARIRRSICSSPSPFLSFDCERTKGFDRLMTDSHIHKQNNSKN